VQSEKSVATSFGLPIIDIMNAGQTEKKTAISASIVVAVLLLIGIAVYGYIKKKDREEERTHQQLPPPTEDQAEKIIKEKQR
jgi:nitric oxide reductase large subunit